VIVDYIQLITPENARDPRQEQVAKISRRLKTMARELKVPVLCLAQLNRQADDGTKAPKLSHLRESGAIEQDADIVLFIHRPNANTPDGGGDCEDAEIHVAKQRNGPTGVVHVRWFRKWCRFENAAEAAWEERKDAVFDAYNKGEDF
jgi:replicative DNA helicase